MPLVIKSAAVPVTIPARFFNIVQQSVRTLGPDICNPGLANAIGKSGKAAGGYDRKPCQPDAFALPLVTDPVHTVIPVPCPDQRQIVPSARHTFIQRPLTMFQQSVANHGCFETGIAVALVGRERRGMKKRDFFLQDCFIAGYLNILTDCKRQPQQIVGAAGPHALVRRRMPPVEDIALLELVRGAVKNMGADTRRIIVQKGHDIL